MLKIWVIMIGGRHPSISAAPGPALLLPGYQHKEIPRSLRALQPLHLQRRQRAVAAELFERGRRSCIGRYLKCLLSNNESRSGTGIRERTYRYWGSNDQRPDSGVHFAQTYAQRQESELAPQPHKEAIGAD